MRLFGFITLVVCVTECVGHSDSIGAKRDEPIVERTSQLHYLIQVCKITPEVQDWILGNSQVPKFKDAMFIIEFNQQICNCKTWFALQKTVCEQTLINHLEREKSIDGIVQYLNDLKTSTWDWKNVI